MQREAFRYCRVVNDQGTSRNRLRQLTRSVYFDSPRSRNHSSSLNQTSMSGYKPPHLRSSGGTVPPAVGSAAPRTGGPGERGGSSFGDRGSGAGDRYGDQQADRRSSGIAPRGGSSSSLERDGASTHAFSVHVREGDANSTLLQLQTAGGCWSCFPAGCLFLKSSLTSSTSDAQHCWWGGGSQRVAH